jgi:hypothetical protein
VSGVQFDSATLASMQAALLARSVAGQFVFTTRAATVYDPLFISHAVAETVRPQTASYQQRSVVTWSAVYRSPAANVLNPDGKTVAYPTGGIERAFGPESIVCDTAQLSIAQGLLLQWATECFNKHDQRMKQGSGLVPQKVP